MKGHSQRPWIVGLLFVACATTLAAASRATTGTSLEGPRRIGSPGSAFAGPPLTAADVGAAAGVGQGAREHPPRA